MHFWPKVLFDVLRIIMIITELIIQTRALMPRQETKERQGLRRIGLERERRREFVGSERERKRDYVEELISEVKKSAFKPTRFCLPALVEAIPCAKWESEC